MCAKSLSHVQLCVTPWTVAGQPSLSMEFFQATLLELCCHFLLQGISPTLEWKLHLMYLLQWQADSLPLHHMESARWQR